MPNMKEKLSNEVLAALPIPSKDTEKSGYMVWDTELMGFGCRVYPTGKKAFYVDYRSPDDGRKRKYRIGTLGPFTVTQARAEAKRVIAEIELGHDPGDAKKERKDSKTVEELANEFLEKHSRPNKSPSSVRNDELWIERYIKPELGQKKVAKVTFADVDQLHKSIGRDKPYAANRTLACLSTMMSFAERWEMRPPQTNPCPLVRRYPEKPNHQDLSAADLYRLDQVLTAIEKEARANYKRLTADEKEPKTAKQRIRTAAVIRLLLLTGSRLNEIASLRWEEVDLENGWLNLTSTKTGVSSRPLNSHAIKILEKQRELTPEGEWVFPGREEKGPIQDVKKLWARYDFVSKRTGKVTPHDGIRDDAGIPKFRLHHFRHNFITWGESIGFEEWMVGKIVGHATGKTITRRYAGLREHPAKNASQMIADEMLKAIKEEAKKLSLRRGGAGTRRRKPPKRGK